MITFYVDSNIGVDESSSGTVSKPFKTLDYCISQMHSRNIRSLNLDNEEELLELLEEYPKEQETLNTRKNKMIEDGATINESHLSEEEAYLYNIISRASDDDVTIYLADGEYDFSNRNLFNYATGRSITIIGTGKNTIFYNHFNGGNTFFGTAGLNIYFKRFIWDNIKNQTVGTNAFIFNGKFYFENILFENIPNDSYGFFLPRQGLHMKNCVKSKFSSNFYRNDCPESSLVGFYGYFSMGYASNMNTINPNENNVLLTDDAQVQLDENYRITDDNIDTNVVGLYAGEYSWKITKALIKKNDEYYTINKEYYDLTSQSFNKLDTIDFSVGFSLDDLIKEVTYGEDTFIPIDKFDNFQIIFDEDTYKKIQITAYKIDEKIIETNPIDLKMVDRFNSFQINGENVKCLIKINEENILYSYDFDNNELIIENKDNIKTNSININDVVNIDFNKIKEEKGLHSISFVFYITKESYINNIEFTYLGLGDYLQKSGTEINLKNGYKKISITPKFNTSNLKINAIWGNIESGENGETQIDCNKCLLETQYNSLNTNNKTIIGAINELKKDIINNSNSNNSSPIGNGTLAQKVLLNVQNNKRYNIPINNSNNRVLTQAFKFVEGEQNIIETIKSFQNNDKDNFYYDENNVIFNNEGSSIKNLFNLETINNNNLFESLMDEKNKFLELKFEDMGAELVDITPRMTSDTTPAPYKIITSSYYGAGFEGWRAFDGVEHTTSDKGWCTTSMSSNQTYEPYIMVDFGDKINLSEIWLGAYGYNSYHATKVTISYSQDDITFVEVGEYNLSYDYNNGNSIYEKIKFNNVINARFLKIQVDSWYNNGSYTGFSEIKIFENKEVNFLIKENNNYYTIENNSLKQIETEVNEEVITNNGIKLRTINENLNILPNKFSFISNEAFELIIKGLKENKQLIIASDDFSLKIQENIDYFECKALQNGNGQIKIAFSEDNGENWKSYKDGNFIDLNCNIPLKEFKLLTDEELTLFNTSKQKIYEEGIDYNELKNIDFNSLNLEKIRFAYVLSVENSEDIAINKELIWQFDSKGSLKKLKEVEFDLELRENSIEFTSLINCDMIKINIFNG